MSIRTIILSAALAAAVAVPAKADVIWAVSGTFDDGGTLTGQFTINTYGYLESNYSLTTTAGTTLPGFTYNSGDSYFSNGAFYVDFEQGYETTLHLSFADILSVASSDNPLVGGSPGPSWECAGSYSCYLPSGGETRYIASGSASAIPEASTWALMLVGFAGLGLAGYRQARSARAIV